MGAGVFLSLFCIATICIFLFFYRPAFLCRCKAWRCTRNAAAFISPASSSSSSSSYTYWVRRPTQQAVPLPPPRKLSDLELGKTRPPTLGSAWNQAGTWEEKDLTSWATKRLKVLLSSIEPLRFPEGKARITEVSSCTGEATVVTVRNKKRIGYSYAMSMKFEGEWKENKNLEGNLKIPEVNFGELDEVQLEVTIRKDRALTGSDINDFSKVLRSFLPSLREKFLKFEEELKEK